MNLIKYFLALGAFLFTMLASAQADLKDTEKDRILFMLFENHNRKLLPFTQANCKTMEEKSSWYCENSTIKKYLMGLYRIKSFRSADFMARVSCQEIQKEMQKQIFETENKLEYGAIPFRREVNQALKGQWLCFFKAEQKLLGGKEKFDDQSLWQSAQTEPTIISGLTFLLNKDKNRIISKNISVWWTFN